MATTIKKVVQKRLTEQKINSIKETFNLPNDWEDSASFNCNIILSKGNSRFVFSFGIEGDPHCCGMRSLGSFNISTTTAISEEEKIKGVKKGFERLMDILKDGSMEITAQFTLIDNPACNLLKKVFADGKLFTKVKTFKNINTNGRVNDLYVSN